MPAKKDQQANKKLIRMTFVIQDDVQVLEQIKQISEHESCESALDGGFHRTTGR